MPDSFEELFDRAKRALAEGWPDQALVPATEAVKLAPQRADARLLLARAWLGNAGWARAISDARAVLELAPMAEEIAGAHDVIGRASLRIRAVADAEASLREVRRLRPTPAASALLAALLVDTERGADAVSLAREDAARSDDAHDWETPRLAFEALANVLAADAPREEPLLALADLFWDVGLLDEAKTRYRAALDVVPGSERAVDGYQRLAEGAKERPRPKLRAPVATASGVRMARLFASGIGGALAIVTMARWEQLAWVGAARPFLLAGGLGIVATCVVLARRDELAAIRAAQARAATPSGGPSS